MAERVQLLRLFTGEHSVANQRLYQRHGYVEDHRTVAGDYQLVYMTVLSSQRAARLEWPTERTGSAQRAARTA
ncbi:MAG TPA: hypothetical protein VGL46_08160 [Pseudonocardiaceae bacterium]